MGFCPEGEGGPFAESGATAISGKIPINPSGGLMARGHSIGASGLRRKLPGLHMEIYQYSSPFHR
ncbi:MAG: thiolase C-terminal domain-containing protein [Desulfomonilia bacterium]